MADPIRDRLYSKLREVLGNENTSALIEMLTPDRDQLATKADIDRLDQRMEKFEGHLGDFQLATKGDIDRLDRRMEKFEGHLWDFHGALRGQTRIFATMTVTAMLGVGTLVLGAVALMI